MSDTTYELEVPASQIHDVNSFEASRAEAYSLTDLQERQAALERLLGTAQVVGDVVLSDVLLERLTHSDEYLERAQDQLETISDMIVSEGQPRHHDAEAYRFRIDASGDVLDVMHIIPVEEDKTATDRSHRVANSIGWGPKQNSASGRFGIPRKQDMPKGKRRA